MPSRAEDKAFRLAMMMMTIVDDRSENAAAAFEKRVQAALREMAGRDDGPVRPVREWRRQLRRYLH